MNPKFIDRPFVAPAFILAGSVIIGTLIGCFALYSVRSLGDVITTTGSATADAKADSAKWTLSVYRSVTQDGVPDAYGSVARDEVSLKKYLETQGISESDITEGAVYADQDYSYNQNGPKMYNVHEDVTVASKDVEKIASLSKNIGLLVVQGVLVTQQPPQYYISNLADLRVSLLGKAVADAKARAAELAKSSGASVGSLRSASSGVVQVLTQNSTDISDYGSYDTSTIDKTVMVTARATFSVR